MLYKNTNPRQVFEGSGRAKPLRYSEESLTRTAEGKKARITLINGTVIAGVLRTVSMYDLNVNDGVRDLIVFKSAIATVEVS